MQEPNYILSDQLHDYLIIVTETSIEFETGYIKLMDLGQGIKEIRISRIGENYIMFLITVDGHRDEYVFTGKSFKLIGTERSI